MEIALDSATTDDSGGGKLSTIVYRLRHDWTALVASSFLTLVVAACLLAPFTAPYDPFAMAPAIRLAPPGTIGHLLGTDGAGRDLLSRLIWGGRTSLLEGTLPIVVGWLAGGTIGLLAGYFGGPLRLLLMRAVDILFAFPAVLLAIAIAVTLGPGVRNMVIALAIVLIPTFARITETATVSVCAMPYIEAAKASGARHWSIMARQILPNVLPPAVAYAFSVVGPVIVFASGLSFLGLGVAPPNPEWGSMLFALHGSIYLAPVTSSIPGIPILLVALAFDTLGGLLRDVLDPGLAV